MPHKNPTCQPLLKKTAPSADHRIFVPGTAAFQSSELVPGLADRRSRPEGRLAGGMLDVGAGVRRPHYVQRSGSEGVVVRALPRAR